MLCFLLLLPRLNMDRLSFLFSLLLIVSVSTSTFGSVMKAKNPNGEVKEKKTSVIGYNQIFLVALDMAFLVLFT